VYQAIQKQEAIQVQSEHYKEMLESNLNWKYGFEQATLHRPKQSVTELKRKMQEEDPYTQTYHSTKSFPLERPKFMSEKKMNQAEKGTATHAVMQNIDYQFVSTIHQIQEQIDQMVLKELITNE
ncbi:hypothetical protein, partial [Pseudomonas sp. FW305-BF6]|uniref:hypothetical protein n=1 Tax=Pseudomonas sp. FW305-BF6 TaxID=2070673 RepID=UPI001C45551F